MLEMRKQETPAPTARGFLARHIHSKQNPASRGLYNDILHVSYDGLGCITLAMARPS